MNAANSDQERARELCEITHHDWQEEYYGYRCANCGEFIPYGCEPWAPDEGATEFPDDDPAFCWDGEFEP